MLATGYGLVIGERDPARVRGAGAWLSGRKVAILQTDVSQERDVRRLAAAAKAEFGGAEVFVCDAAIANPVNGSDLASDAARFITGRAFTIDGGMTRKTVYEV